MEHVECPEHRVPTVNLSTRPITMVDRDTASGTVFANRYQLRSILGSGGTGTIFAAQQLSMDRPVALKILHARLLADNEALARFYREVRSATLLEHPNVVRIFDFGVDELTHQPYIAMNLVEGRSLASILNDGPLSEPHAARLMAQVARALLAAHGKGLVHRDLKPENIIVSTLPGGMEHATVVDFGMARLPDNIPLHTTLGDSAPRKIMGTPLYMSPEQIQRQPADLRSDLYSFGCILYECVVGKPAFERENHVACMFAHLEVAPPPLPDALCDGSPPSNAIRSLCSWLMAKSRDNRPESAHTLIDVLSLLASGHQDAAWTMLSADPDAPHEIAATNDLQRIPLDSIPPEPTEITEPNQRAMRIPDATTAIETSIIITLPVAIDERFEPDVSALAKKTAIVFDFDRVRRVTSFGVREWVRFLKQLPSKSYYCFIKCHAMVVSQLNFLTDFSGRGEVLSLFAPYECMNCGDRVELLIDVVKQKPMLDALDLPSLRCPRCLVESQLDEPPEIYFDYVIKSPAPRPPAAVLELLGMSGGPQRARRADFGVSKEVGERLTIFRFGGVLDDRASLRRLGEGVEDGALLDFGDLVQVVGEGVPKLVRFMRELQCPIHIVNADLGVIEQIAPSIDLERVATIEGVARCKRCGNVRRVRLGTKPQDAAAGTCCGTRLSTVAAIERLLPRRAFARNDEVERYINSATTGGKG
jgi:serine/threonine protein kinase